MVSGYPAPSYRGTLRRTQNWWKRFILRSFHREKCSKCNKRHLPHIPTMQCFFMQMFFRWGMFSFQLGCQTPLTTYPILTKSPTMAIANTETHLLQWRFRWRLKAGTFAFFVFHISSFISISSLRWNKNTYFGQYYQSLHCGGIKTLNLVNIAGNRGERLNKNVPSCRPSLYV